MTGQWIDLGSVEDLKQPPQRVVKVAGKPVALTFVDGRFGAVSGVCNHAGGPLGEGELHGKRSASLRQGAATLVDRAMALAATLLAGTGTDARVERAGRKAFDPAGHKEPHRER